MTKCYFHNSYYILLLAGLFMNSCNGQVNTSAPKETTNASKPNPEIIGTPPRLVPQTGVEYDPLLVGQYIRTIFQDSKGNLWFGPAGESVARYDEKTLTYFSKSEFFHGNTSVDQDYGNSVHAIAEDKNGNIWFGTDHGVIKYDARLPNGQGKTLPTGQAGLPTGQAGFRSYTEESGLSNIKVGRKSILIDKAGTIWVGTQGGVFRYHPSADTTGGKCFSQFDLLPPIKVTDIMEDNTGNIWFASHDNGVFRYDPSAQPVLNETEGLRASGKAIINITEKEGLGDNYAGGMIQDKSGNFWFTMKGGICRYDARLNDEVGQGKTLPAGQAGLPAGHAGFTEFTTKDGLGGSEVWGIYMEKSGIIWITARGSTTRYDPSIDISNPKAFTVFTVEDGINCCVQSMYQDRSGNMWWGTGQGLYRFDARLNEEVGQGKRFYQVKQNGPW